MSRSVCSKMASTVSTRRGLPEWMGEVSRAAGRNGPIQRGENECTIPFKKCGHRGVYDDMRGLGGVP